MRTKNAVSARRWLWTTSLAAGVLLIAAAVLGFQLAAVQVGLSRTAAGDHAAAETAFAAAEGPAVVDRWVPPFDRGTAQYRLAQWDAAAASFERALAMAPLGAQCRVRLNWAWSLEAGADALAKTDASGAMARLTQAQMILATAPCEDQPADGQADNAPAGSLEDQRNDTRNRLSEKAGQTQPPNDSDEQPSDAPPPENSAKLSHRQQLAEQQRQQVMDQRGNTSDTDGEKTW